MGLVIIYWYSMINALIALFVLRILLSNVLRLQKIVNLDLKFFVFTQAAVISAVFVIAYLSLMPGVSLAGVLRPTMAAIGLPIIAIMQIADRYIKNRKSL